MQAEIADLFEAHEIEHRDAAEAAEEDAAARWLAAQERTPADRRAYYARNRARLAAARLASYHRTKVLTGRPSGPAPKLTLDEVLTIRAIARTDPDATPIALAEHFGVSRETIWAVLTGRTWRAA